MSFEIKLFALLGPLLVPEERGLMWVESDQGLSDAEKKCRDMGRNFYEMVNTEGT